MDAGLGCQTFTPGHRRHAFDDLLAHRLLCGRCPSAKLLAARKRMPRMVQNWLKPMLSHIYPFLMISTLQVLILPPALAQLGFVYYFQSGPQRFLLALHGRMAIFVDCLSTLAVLLSLYVLASTAQVACSLHLSSSLANIFGQVYAMLPRFRSPMKAQSSVLALNVATGFFLALTVPMTESWVDFLSYQVKLLRKKRAISCSEGRFNGGTQRIGGCVNPWLVFRSGSSASLSWGTPQTGESWVRDGMSRHELS